MKSKNLVSLIGIIGYIKGVLEREKMAFKESRGHSVIKGKL